MQPHRTRLTALCCCAPSFCKEHILSCFPGAFRTSQGLNGTKDLSVFHRQCWRSEFSAERAVVSLNGHSQSVLAMWLACPCLCELCRDPRSAPGPPVYPNFQERAERSFSGQAVLSEPLIHPYWKWFDNSFCLRSGAQGPGTGLGFAVGLSSQM